MHFQYEPIGDENIFQDFCKDLLNCVYQTQSFELYKTKGATQSGIDILSTTHKVVAQCKKKKLLRSDKALERELINDLDESIKLFLGSPIDSRRFVLITTTKKYGRVQDRAIFLSQSNSFEIIFWSWEDIEKFIAQYVELRSKYYPHLFQNESVIPQVITYIPNIHEEEIVGRETDLLNLETLIDSSRRTVLVNGLGGVGKSTLAKLFVRKNFRRFSHIIWLDVHADFSKKKLVGISPLLDAFANNITLLNNLQLPIEDLAPEDQLMMILNKLQNISGLNLLVIDNTSADIRELENKFPFDNWKILLTSREEIEGYSLFNLEVLNDEDAIRLFYQYYRIERSNLVINLLNYIGNHTLTIELLAKTAQKRRLSIHKLVELLEQNGLQIPKTAKVFVDHDPQKNPTTLFEYLLKIFSISDLTEEQIQYLRYFSILNSTPISYDDSKLLFGIPEVDNEFFDNISELASKGWLKELDGNYQIHQIVQEVLRAKLEPNESNCILLLNTLSKVLTISWETNPFDIRRFVEYAESVASHIENSDDSKEIAELYSILGLREEDLFNLEKSLLFNHKAVSIYEKDIPSNAIELSGRYNNLQSVYKTLGRIDEAFNFQFKAIELEEEYQHPLHPDVGTSYNNLSLLYEIEGDLESALDYQERAILIAEYNLAENHPHLAGAYNNYSLLLHKIGLIDKALLYQQKSFDIRKQVLAENHPELAQAHGNIAAMYESIDKLDEAEYHTLKSIEIRKEIYSNNHYTLGASYNNLASIYLKRKDFQKAHEFQMQAISIEVDALGDSHYTLGNTYSTMAVIQLQLGNLIEAKQYVERAISISKKNFAEGHPNRNIYDTFLDHIDNLLRIKD
ncbi:hypothetical protein ACM40_15785 [Chryseobacterium sp. BLS98]|uniref:tetratricopeptide repeat protein n=1 Tax=Chryseobacterium sp. BLS98 TaxID=885586 RepID=UPI00065ADE6F|nr:tetratricopeptide repeat protein [Chryseobacterium sp. BLS98]KMQ61154.1 hypothetical protein ACM40_15785 [Chryseobacterium sp. BLS98]